MTRLSTTASSQRLMLKRVKQIVWFVQFALLGNLALLVVRAEWLQAGVVGCLSLNLLWAAWLAHKGRFESSATLLITILSIGVFAIVWSGGGLYDLGLVALPGIVIFAAMLGMHRVYYSLLLFSVINILLLGYAEGTGLIIFDVSTQGVGRAVAISFILVPIVLSTWLMAKDYRTALDNLADTLKAMKESNDEAEFWASHDALTQLPNRTLARERFIHATKIAARTPDTPRMGLFYMDLDGFKGVNDSHGHHVGDEFLKFIAAQLTGSIRECDTVARLGGDEFLVLVEQVKEIDELMVIAENLLAASQRPFRHKEQTIVGSASIGVAVYPDDSSSYEELVQQADLAMYHSKESGRKTINFFNGSMSQEAHFRAEMLEDIKRALELDEFYLVYQPIINLKTGLSEGAEALLRWRHPSKGEISPAVFVPLAEQTGLIVDIGTWVLDQAMKDGLKFEKALEAPYLISVNVSAVQLKRGNFIKILESTFSRHPLPYERLFLELTESEMLADNQAFDDFLRYTQEQQIRIAIDDFGTGYSNLGYLHRVDIARIKLDHSFIQEIDKNKEKRSIVASIQHLAEGLKVETVAEGVETALELELIKKLGVNRAQGYCWTKPLRFNEAVEFVLAQRSEVAN